MSRSYYSIACAWENPSGSVCLLSVDLFVNDLRCTYVGIILECDTQFLVSFYRIQAWRLFYLIWRLELCVVSLAVKIMFANNTTDITVVFKVSCYLTTFPNLVRRMPWSVGFQGWYGGQERRQYCRRRMEGWCLLFLQALWVIRPQIDGSCIIGLEGRQVANTFL